MPAQPDDHQIQALIDRLEEEAGAIRSREGEQDPSQAEDVQRLDAIRVDLERLWDLLRQRRALRDAGEDPDGAHERSAELIERYWQ